MVMIAHLPSTEQEPTSVSDVRAAAVLGIALANARNKVAHSVEMALTAGTQYDLARDVTLIVVGKAAEIQPSMTVTQLMNLIETGRR
jgi:hypothetical protein